MLQLLCKPLEKLYAESLFISENTVFLLKHIYAKLDVHSKQEI
ncbi:MAG: LuxR C-terminal-related transcriptional regulator [Eggerthella lenta]